MALEDRIKVLEDEIAILKGQIHTTLLEIHEQILNHYYPELRADDSGLPEASGSARPARALGFVGLQRVTLEEPGPTAAEQDRAEAQVAAAEATPRPGSENRTSWPMVAQLMKWASDSVERIGAERTAKALEICAQGGCLTPEVRDMLLRFIALSDEGAAPATVGLRAIADALSELNDILGSAAEPSGADPAGGEV